MCIVLFLLLSCVASIVEFDQLDELDFDYVGRLASVDTPEKVTFARRAAERAGLALSIFARYFDNDVYKAAEESVF